MLARLRNGRIKDQKIILILILGLGLFLRVYQLGEDAFWVDELGVAMAAFQDSIRDVIYFAKTHIMAMPLDYVVVWLVARFSHSEFFLRLPEAIWGTATLFAGYLLFVELSKQKNIALLATFLLALSPIHIRYSQELRFYAPLVFFYIFSTWLGIQALKRSTLKLWFFFTITVVIGLYFHFYILFALGNIVLLFFVSYRKLWFEQNRFSFFAASALIIFLFFIVGLLFFGSVYANPIPLQLYWTIDTFLLTGLGWLPPFPSRPVTLIWGYLCAGFALLGMVVSLKKSIKSETSVLIYGIVIQICAIIYVNFAKNYFLSARQLLMLVPLMLFYSAIGVCWLIDKIAKRQSKVQLPFNLLWLLVVAVFTISAIPVLGDYYRSQKSSVEEVMSLLSHSWLAEEKILISPPSNLALFTYYASEMGEISQVMEPVDLAQINSDLFQFDGGVYIIVNYPVGERVEQNLFDAGFSPVYVPSDDFLYPQMVWRR